MQMQDSCDLRMTHSSACSQIHSPRTTVREALQFSADLRFEGRPGRAELRAFVDEVMDLVELGPVQNSLVCPCSPWCQEGEPLMGRCSVSAALEGPGHATG